MSNKKKTPSKWLEAEFSNIEILEPDGWRDKAWNKKITRAEFHERLMQCTIRLKGGFFSERPSNELSI